MLRQTFSFRNMGLIFLKAFDLGAGSYKNVVCGLSRVHQVHDPKPRKQDRIGSPRKVGKETMLHTIVACVGIFWTKHMTSITKGHNSLAVAMTWAPIEFFCISFSSLQPLLLKKTLQHIWFLVVCWNKPSECLNQQPAITWCTPPSWNICCDKTLLTLLLQSNGDSIAHISSWCCDKGLPHSLVAVKWW